LAAAGIRRPNVLNPTHAWALRRAIPPYLAWYLGRLLRPPRRPALPPMPKNLRAHAEFAADALPRAALEVSGTMRRFQLALADRQCRMAELSARVQKLTILLATALFAARQPDELVQEAADVLCRDLTRELTGQRPSDDYFRAVTRLGEAIADGKFASIAELPGGEILMPYPP
jgi:hypothetical protein